MIAFFLIRRRVYGHQSVVAQLNAALSKSLDYGASGKGGVTVSSGELASLASEVIYHARPGAPDWQEFTEKAISGDLQYSGRRARARSILRGRLPIGWPDDPPPNSESRRSASR